MTQEEMEAAIPENPTEEQVRAVLARAMTTGTPWGVMMPLISASMQAFGDRIDVIIAATFDAAVAVVIEADEEEPNGRIN